MAKVQHLAVSTYTLGPAHLEGVGKIFTVLLADQHWKRSLLARASTCLWTQGTEYFPQVTQTARFQSVHGMATLSFTGTRGTFTSKTSICRSGRGSENRKICHTHKNVHQNQDFNHYCYKCLIFSSRWYWHWLSQHLLFPD